MASRLTAIKCCKCVHQLVNRHAQTLDAHVHMHGTLGCENFHFFALGFEERSCTSLAACVNTKRALEGCKIQHIQHSSLVVNPVVKLGLFFFVRGGGGERAARGRRRQREVTKVNCEVPLKKKEFVSFRRLGRGNERTRVCASTHFKPCWFCARERKLTSSHAACSAAVNWHVWRLAAGGGLLSNMTHPDVVGGFDQVIFAQLGPVHFAHLF